uniref:Cyclin dependent kinase 2 interacting protein n=1 Tax=Salmo trutta TaxID=8032 RepID=A0A674AEV3_SALTR
LEVAIQGSEMTTPDNVADWHNLILKWDRLNDEGSTIPNKMVNLSGNLPHHLKKICLHKEMEVMMEDQDTSATSNSENVFGNSSELQDELLSVMDKMTRIVYKMKLKFQYGTGRRQTPLFQTWPISVSSKLYEAYKRDRTLKRAILQELAHTTNTDLSMVHLSCRLYQSYIENSAKLLLEGLLLETGHRPI